MQISAYIANQSPIKTNLHFFNDIIYQKQFISMEIFWDKIGQSRHYIDNESIE